MRFKYHSIELKENNVWIGRPNTQSTATQCVEYSHPLFSASVKSNH